MSPSQHGRISNPTTLLFFYPFRSAFANTPGGGDILLGIDENAGFKSVVIDRSALKKAMVSIARQSVSPPLSLTFEDVEFEGESVLVARVPELSLSKKPVPFEGQQRPICAPGTEISSSQN